MTAGSAAKRDFFISFNKADREWATWIAWELEEAGYTVIFQDWDFRGDFVEQMDQAQRETVRTLAVISDHYFSSGFTVPEWTARFTQDPAGRQDFLVPIKVGRVTELGILRARIYADLIGCDEDAARDCLLSRVRKAIEPDYRPKPATKPGFPGAPAAETPRRISNKPDFPVAACSNVPIRVPMLFMGRDDALQEIENALQRNAGRVAITALHGMRGVGKTTLAAAYAERNAYAYRVTWWVRAQADSSLREDLVALGLRLGWTTEGEKEDKALTVTLQKLRSEAAGILVIFDNATDGRTIEPYLPRGGRCHILLTSNAPDWRNIAEPLELPLWPKEVGAEYLIRRTGRDDERSVAEALSDALGGLPLAHEQAGAYCQRLGISLGTYRTRFDVHLLDTTKDAPADYGRTVAKTFALAIEEAGKLHPAAEPLIALAALLAPEPIPLFLFAEGREKLGEPLASALAGDGLDEAVAALRAFALVDCATIQDERNTEVTTECVRLHRLVRQVSAARRKDEVREGMRCALVAALAESFPNVNESPKTWPRARRLDALALDLVSCLAENSDKAENQISELLHRLAVYRRVVFADYEKAQPLMERAVKIRERVLGSDHLETVNSLNSLGLILSRQSKFAEARPLYERALEVREHVLGPDNPETITVLSNLGSIFAEQGDFVAARPLLERVLEARERVLGPDHLDTTFILNNLAVVLSGLGDTASARSLYERAVETCERVLGSDHPNTASSLSNLAVLLVKQGDLAAARPLCERALAIRERVLGPDHPGTALSRNILISLLIKQDKLIER